MGSENLEELEEDEEIEMVDAVIVPEEEEKMREDLEFTDQGRTFNLEDAPLSAQSGLLRQRQEGWDTGASHSQMELQIDMLLQSKKKNLLGLNSSDSTQMQEFKENIRLLTDLLDGNIPKDQNAFSRTSELIMQLYRKSISSGEAYIKRITGSRMKGRSDSAKSRLSLVRQILSRLTTERRLIITAAKSLFANGKEDEVFTWKDALYETRATKFDLSDPSKVEIIGAGSSRIYKYTGDDGKVRFIKPEQRVTRSTGDDVSKFDYLDAVGMYRASAPANAAFLNMLEEIAAEALGDTVDLEAAGENGEKQFMQGFYKSLDREISGYIPPAEKEGKTEDQLNRIREDSKIEALSALCKKSPVGRAVWASINNSKKKVLQLLGLSKFIHQKFTEADNALSQNQGVGMEEGSTVSDRNVSTSILAERLGRGHLIAKSETVIMEDEFGRNVRANSMEKAEGMSFADITDLAKAEGKSVSFTPESLTQYFELRIMDMIAGQIDRHDNNFFVTSHEEDGVYYIDSVKGIDNDLSFGLMTFERIEAHHTNFLDGFTNSTGRQEIFCITKDFFQSVMTYDDELIEYDHFELRSKKEIEAMKDRIRGVKENLIKLVETGQILLVDTPEEMRKGYENARDYYGQISGKLFHTSGSVFRALK